AVFRDCSCSTEQDGLVTPERRVCSQHDGNARVVVRCEPCYYRAQRHAIVGRRKSVQKLSPPSDSSTTVTHCGDAATTLGNFTTRGWTCEDSAPHFCCS